jgi:hypothetical protein
MNNAIQENLRFNIKRLNTCNVKAFLYFYRKAFSFEKDTFLVSIFIYAESHSGAGESCAES